MPRPARKRLSGWGTGLAWAAPQGTARVGVAPARASNGVDVDISFAAFPFELEVLEQASDWQATPDIALRTCSAEDLLLYKLVAAHLIDLHDVQSVVEGCRPSCVPSSPERDNGGEADCADSLVVAVSAVFAGPRVTLPVHVRTALRADATGASVRAEEGFGAVALFRHLLFCRLVFVFPSLPCLPCLPSVGLPWLVLRSRDARQHQPRADADDEQAGATEKAPTIDSAIQPRDDFGRHEILRHKP